MDVGQPRFASDGAFLGYVGNVLDITERRQAELAREESEALIQACLKARPIASACLISMAVPCL
ncbi:hypothetical protein CN151_30495 [Sinorhizobium meliloti]|uniref:hypothetical protein n=1 Tax=Rhizobium meliloti TaxID=382 RepID=UPI000FD5B4B6|nr:hypothetical protein [Sinorhizobium meliloti]RVK93819.1 hypothetical protein CN151_30495 [Sinorhizobium meliloti]RVM85822.1 hypothetical protein CN119_30580 [Sinorhizobium meliloti]RVN02502.1 hypothetical protein CN112_29350 [Sinorhizobium meliloti]